MKKIAILGASEIHLPLFLKAREMGLETYCFAWSEGAFCKDYADHYYDISITDKERIVKVCEAEKINGIISNAIEIAVPTMAYVSEKLHMNGISYKAALRARNKYLMRQTIESCKACLQPSFRLYSEKISMLIFPIIVKPTDGSCSNGVTKVSSMSELPEALKRANSASNNHEILIEEYIEGREISVESISYNGKHYVLAITDKETTGSPYFVETAHHQPSNLNIEMQNKVKKCTHNILIAMEINNGASHAEYKIDSKGNVFFIEIGARGGGDYISYDLVELSTGYDFIRGMINVALKNFEPPICDNSKFSGIYFLSEETADVKDFIEENKNKMFIKRYYIDNAPLKRLKKSQDRSGYIIYQSDKKIFIS